jgi:hypothetical protein
LELHFEVEGDAAVHKYKAKTSISACMCSPPDGRTVSGMKHNIDELRKRPETIPSANELAAHKADVELCALLRPDKIFDTSKEQLEMAINHLMKRFDAKLWPVETRQNLVARYVDDDFHAGNFKIVADRCGAFTPGIFDATDPKIGCMEDVDEAGRISLSNRLMFKDCMLHLIEKGKAGHSEVLRYVAELKNQFATFDPIENSKLARSANAERVRICEYVQFVGESRSGAELEDRLGSVIHNCYLFYIHFGCKQISSFKVGVNIFRKSHACYLHGVMG